MHCIGLHWIALAMRTRSEKCIQHQVTYHCTNPGSPPPAHYHHNYDILCADGDKLEEDDDISDDEG